mmetsp:Transcript_13025/g.17933  ORF Transcript_13025/g.17933 Transcript_13025/m.17933 type:complete len:443 (-) Transcript_13025:38-1366(-)
MTNNMDEETTTSVEDEYVDEDIMENEPDYLNEQQQQQQQSNKKPRILLGICLCIFALCAAFRVTYYRRSDGLPTKLSAQYLHTEEDEFGEVSLNQEEFEYFDGTKEISETSPSLESLAKRMEPRNILYNTTIDSDGNKTTTFPPKQFFHLHHMKTGGTSIDAFLHCGTNRLSQQIGSPIPQYQLSECAHSTYQKCISHNYDACTSRVESAAKMSFCAPLAQANAFDWTHADAITTIRNPIDRVWSMYRFSTKRCYCCFPLQQVYEEHEAGTLKEKCPNAYGGVCMAQLYDHQTRNLLTTLEMEEMEEEAKMKEAIYNLEHRFAVVGLTHELPAYVQMLGEVFPWLSEDGVETEDTEKNGEEEREPKKCVLGHANASPMNNGCGEDGGNLPLDDDPDEETRRAIEERNRLDMELFRAAVRHFSRQKEALGWDLTEEDEEKRAA